MCKKSSTLLDEDTIPATTRPDHEPEEAEASSLHSRYQIVGEIARGGMGVVFDAHDPVMRRDVAIKLMLSAASDDQAMVRFVEEAQVQAQLEHPNICPIYDFGFDPDGNPYMVMMRVRGRSMRKLIADPKRRLHDLVEAFAKTCDAVAFAHSKGVIHRDLKPENVMVGEFGEVLVMDWGIAKLGSSNEPGADAVVSDRVDGSMFDTRDGSIMGSPSYMAPEQAAGDLEAIDNRTDVYALGAILYTILTGEPPVEADNLRQLITRTVRGEIRPPHERVTDGDVLSDLSACALKALALEPEDRYQWVQELREDVARYLEGQPLVAATYTVRQLMAKWVARNRALSFAIVVFTVVTSLGIGLFIAQTISASYRDRLMVARERIARGDALATSDRPRSARAAYRAAREDLSGLGEDTRPVDLALWELSFAAPEAIASFPMWPQTVKTQSRFVDIEASKDGRTLFLADERIGVGLWDATTGRAKGYLTEEAKGVFGLTTSPDRELLYLLLERDGRLEVRAIDLAKRTELARWQIPFTTSSGVFEADTKPLHVWISSRHELMLLDLESKQVSRYLEGSKKKVRSLAVSRDGKWIAASSDDERLRSWNLETGEMRVLSENVWSPDVAFSPDSERIVYCRKSGQVRVRAIDSDADYAIGRVEGTMLFAEITEDGKSVVVCELGGRCDQLDVGREGRIRSFVAPEPETKKRTMVHGDVAQILPGSQRLATVRSEKVEIWPLDLSLIGFIESEFDSVVHDAMAVPGTDTLLVSTKDSHIYVLSESGQKELKPGYRGVVRHIDQQHAFIAIPGGVEVIDLATHEVAAFHPTDRWVRSVGQAGGRLLILDDLEVSTRSSTGAPDASRRVPKDQGLVVANNDTVIIATQVGVEILSPLLETKASLRVSGIVSAAAMTRDGRTAAVGLHDGRIMLFGTEGEVEGTYISAHESRVNTIDFSPNGRLLVTGGEDRIVRIFEVNTMRELRAIRHPDPIRRVRFSPDGKRLAWAFGKRLRVADISGVLTEASLAQ